MTKLRTAQGELVVVPNSALRQVTNLSKDWSRAVIDIPVAVTEDLERVTAHPEGGGRPTMAADPRWSDLLLGEPVVAGVETIDVGYVQLRLIARTLPGRQFEVAREIRLRAATALRSAGVSLALDRGLVRHERRRAVATGGTRPTTRRRRRGRRGPLRRDRAPLGGGTRGGPGGDGGPRGRSEDDEVRHSALVGFMSRAGAPAVPDPALDRC